MIDLMTLSGVGVGFGVVLYILHEGGMMDFLMNPRALVLIFGGTFGSVLISYPWSAVRHVPKALRMMLRPPKRPTPAVLIAHFVVLAEKARKSGLDSLAEDLDGMPHPFMADGLQMILDGLDADVMRDRFERDMLATRQRHQQISSIFRSAGTYAPIFGLLGTLIGVVDVLKHMTDTAALSGAMAVAMTSSFYGIFSANFLFLPIATKLNFYSDEESLSRELIAKGMLAVLQGEAPWLVSRKLEGYMSYYLRRGGAKRYQVPA